MIGALIGLGCIGLVRRETRPRTIFGGATLDLYRDTQLGRPVSASMLNTRPLLPTTITCPSATDGMIEGGTIRLLRPILNHTALGDTPLERYRLHSSLPLLASNFSRDCTSPSAVATTYSPPPTTAGTPTKAMSINISLAGTSSIMTFRFALIASHTSLPLVVRSRAIRYESCCLTAR